jgi:hypothetical protein
MDSWTADHTELARDLTDRLRIRLLDPLDLLVGLDQGIVERAEEAVHDWTRTLLGTDATAARLTAIRLVSVLYPGDAVFDPPPRWWNTVFGRVVLEVAGHPGAEAVGYPVAAEMLGITRQGVHDLVKRGKLDRDAEGRVPVESVRERLRARRTQRQTEGSK